MTARIPTVSSWSRMLGPHVPDLIALQMLVTVGDTGSLSRAAMVLGVSQQAVSARMRALEGQVGATLLARSARGSTLTATGRVVAGWASEVLAAAARLDAGLASIRDRAHRQLDVAASLTIAEYLLPGWLVALRGRQETLGLGITQVGLVAANSEGVIERVRSGRVPLGFIETPALPSDLAVCPIGVDELCVAVAPGHPWAIRRSPVTARELAGTPLVMREPGSGTRQALERILQQTAPDVPLPQPRVELSSTAAVRGAIVGGLGPGVLSSLAIADDVALGRLVTVATTGLPLRRQLSAVWQAGSAPPAGPADDLVVIASRSLGLIQVVA